MKRRRLGRNGPEVSAIGLGCMGMTMAYGTPNDAESVRTIHRALELGIDFFDTAERYGMGKNEKLLGDALRGKRDKAFIATKFGSYADRPSGADGRPETVRTACENSLRFLAIDTIDLYYQHRVDPDVPVEETVGAMAELVRAGKVRHLGLSEAGAETLRRAHAVHPIAALQSEYSLWTRDCEAEVLPVCRELGIAYVAYAPLGRGFLTGAFHTANDVPSDGRASHPRFQAGNIERNAVLLEEIEKIAQAKDSTPAQVALAWVLARGDDVIPIPGTKKRTYLEENAAAVELALGADEIAALDTAFPPGVTAGDRYPSAAMRLLQM